MHQTGLQKKCTTNYFELKFVISRYILNVYIKIVFSIFCVFANSHSFGIAQAKFPSKINQISLQPWNVVESQIYNPAAAGFLNNYATSLGYESSIDTNAFKIGAFIPTASAMLGINYVSFENVSSGQVSSHLISTSYAKSYGDNFSLGIQLFSSINTSSGAALFGFTPGFFYRSGGVLGGFKSSFFRRWYLFAMTNLLFEDSSYDLSRFGIGLDIFQNSVITIQSLLETEHRVDYSDSLPVISGLNIKWKFIQVNGSYYYYNAIQNSDVLSVGLSFNPVFSGNKYILRYETKFPLDDSSNLTHVVSLAGKLGVNDRTAPVVRVDPDGTYFSPNWDGQKDYIIFKIKVRDRSSIADWKFEIKNSKDRIVRTYSMDRRHKVKVVRLVNLFTEFFQSQIYRYIPKRIIWDGKGNSLLSDVYDEEHDYDLPDGKYFYRLSVTDKNGNKTTTNFRSIQMDRSIPKIEVKLNRNYIVLESGSSQNFINVSHKTKFNSDSVANSWLEDKNGKVVSRFLKSADSTRRLSLSRSSFLVSNNKLLEPGVYKYKCKLSDRAGNITIAVSESIFLVNSKPDILVTVSVSGFSPINGPIALIPKLYHRKRLKEWRIIISPYKNKKIIDREIYKIKSNDKRMGNKYFWDGKDKQGITAPDGLYAIWSEAEYLDRETYKSPPEIVRLDSKGPIVNASVHPAQFSPDQDGFADSVEFLVSIKDSSSISQYRLVINELINHNGKIQRNPIKVWQGKGRYPKKIVWDGVNDKGLFILGLGRYEYKLESTDKYGNYRISRPKKVHSGIQFFNSQSGLKVIIAQAKFNANNSAMDGKTKRNVNRFLSELKKYPTYRVRIEAHTSNEGDEEENLIISEKRAKTVKAYLKSHGLSESRIGFQGNGEINPIRKGPNKADLMKNDRVEFVLIP